MKALILAAGKGKRLNGVLEGKNKCLTMVGNKPIIERILDNITKIHEIREVVIVVGFMAEDIIGYFGESYKNLHIIYVTQKEQKGVVDAMECARNEIAGDDFLLHLGDELMNSPKHAEMLEVFYNQEFFTLVGSIAVDNTELIKKTYTFTYDTDGNITKLVEKPKIPFNNQMGTGNIIFRGDIYNYIDKTPVNPVRGEKELVDLIQMAIDDSKRTSYFEITDYFINLNTIEEFNEIKGLDI